MDNEKNIILNIPEKDISKGETKTLSKSERLLEKLKTLCEKREKAVNAQNAAEKRTKEIDEQINKIKTEIHNDEVRDFDDFCRSKGFVIKDILDFLSAVTDKMTIGEAAEILKIKNNGGNERG
ncbi:MAG: hypothetical protein NC120_10020 [Ruminococcus sp.]|nr:hypothetical protein [Ruminococcus sp.]